jgi:uncharacterized integral membrane protein
MTLGLPHGLPGVDPSDRSTGPALDLKEATMYLSLIITFLLFLGLVVVSLQNQMPLGLKFIAWNLQMPLSALILYSSLIGGSIVAVLALPKLAKKSLHVRRMNRKIHKLEEKLLELEKRDASGSLG